MAEGEVVELAVEVLAANVNGEGASWRVCRGANGMSVVGGDVVDGDGGAGIVEERDGVGGAGQVTCRVGNWYIDTRVLGMTEIVHKVAEENAWNWTWVTVQVSVDLVKAGDANLIGVDAASCTVGCSIGVGVGPEDGDVDSGVVAGPVVVGVEKELRVAGHHLGGDENTAQSDEIGNGTRVGDRQCALLTSTSSSISEVNTTWIFSGLRISFKTTL